MNIVFIIGIIESLFFLLILFSKKKKSDADIILGIWLLIIAINILIPTFTYNDHIKYIRLNGIDYGMLVLHPIFLYTYIKLLISPKDRIKAKHILLHVSVFVINCILVIPYIFMDKEVKLDFLYHSNFPVIAWIGTIWVNLVFIVYLLMASFLIIKHQQNLKYQYSFTENVNFNWIKYLIIGLIAIYLLGSLFGAILCCLGIPLYYINYHVYTALVLFVFGLGYFGIKQKDVFTNIIPDEKKDSIKKPSVITNQDEHFAKKLQRYMELCKPYLNEKLTLQDLAALLKVKSYYITFILNHVMNKNFYDFVNYYRVEEIKKRINKGEIQKYTLLSIAFDCGFNSKASFNRIFKLFTGYSPSKYIELFARSPKF